MQHAVVATISQFQYTQASSPALVDLIENSPRAALRNIDLRIGQGEFVVVSGPSSAGRTTLCYCLTGVIPHALQGTLEGTVEVKGVNLADRPLPQMAGLVGLVLPQPENQLFNLTVEEDIAFGPENLGLEPTIIRSRIDQSLAFVGMESFRQRSSSTLSGGEMQRVVLASILAMDPALLVLDQPASALDPLGRQQIYENIFRLNRERGTTIVVVEDRLDDLLAYASRMILMQGGRIVRDAPPSEFFTDEKVLTSGIRLPSHIRTHDTFNLPTPSAISSSDTKAGRVQIEKLSFRYTRSAQWALRDVNLAINGGEFVAIVGGNGAGKSTLAKHLIGLLRPATGTVTVAGENTERLSTARLANKVGYLFQDPDYQIFANSVFEEVAFGLKIKKVSRDEIDRRVNAMLERLGLLALADNHPYRLSRGQRQRLALATMLVREPSILVVDEPCSGLDYGETLDVMGLLGDFRAGGGTVLMITHDLELVERFATRVVVMSKGEVLLDAPTVELGDHAERLAKAGIGPFRIPGSELGWRLDKRHSVSGIESSRHF